MCTKKRETDALRKCGSDSKGDTNGKRRQIGGWGEKGGQRRELVCRWNGEKTVGE